jgi:hypothetical protein
VRPAKAIGVDIAENTIQYARTAPGHPRNVELMVKTGADLSMIAGSFIDFFYSNDVVIRIQRRQIERVKIMCSFLACYS